MLQNCANTQKQSVCNDCQGSRFLPTITKSLSFAQSSRILWGLRNYQIGSDTFQSSQIVRRLPELQSCFRHFK